MYIPLMTHQRALGTYLREKAKQFPVITLTGCRQSGKTTLLRNLFPHYPYANLEHPETRGFAQEDPRGFLAQFPDGVILDEVQRTPDLFSWIQVASDEAKRPGQFLLSGSQNFLLLERISQSLAGRTLVSHLLPFSLQEQFAAGIGPTNIDQAIFRGGFPRIVAEDLAPVDWLPSYIQSYVERDVRTITQVADLELFQRLLGLCAGRVGQLVNYSALAGEVGVSDKTVRQWIGLLKTSHILFELPPYHRNFGKRLTKSSKLYFCDTGLACSLLGIHSEKELAPHPLRGLLFENLVVLEILKLRFQSGQKSDLHFWRDHVGHEVDLLIGPEHALTAIEIKSTQTLHASLFDGLARFGDLADVSAKDRLLIYGGDQRQVRSNGMTMPWSKIEIE
jgi:predicted AAA+ superfamily ATPase